MPSRSRLSAWIAAGLACVDGRCVRDPAARVEVGARVSLDEEALASGAAALPRSPRPPSRAPLPPGVLFADAQLVVVERAKFAAADGLPVAGKVAACLGRVALHLVNDPSAPGAGPVLLGGSEATRRALEGAVAAGRVLETLLSVRTPAQAGPHEIVLEDGTPAPGRPSTPFALMRREEAPLAPAPPGTRHLVPPQRLALALKHPRTNRRLTFEVGAAPVFLGALVCLGFTG